MKIDLNKTIKEVVVVEGYHDLAKLKEVNSKLEIIITNGSEISEETLIELKKLNELRGLILFLDPDYQGERIRRLINEFVGPTKHAFLKKSDCINKRKNKVGIEHANNDIIKNALQKTYTEITRNASLSMQTLYKYNLVGNTNSKSLRKTLCEELGIGLSNAKTLLKKLNMFGIEEAQIGNILRGE